LQLLFTAGIEVSVYDMEDSRVLVTLQHGWRGYDVKEFLVRQQAHLVEEVEWDQVKYKPEGAAAGATQTAAASRKKKRSTRKAAGKEGPRQAAGGGNRAPPEAGMAAGGEL